MGIPSWTNGKVTALRISYQCRQIYIKKQGNRKRNEPQDLWSRRLNVADHGSQQRTPCGKGRSCTSAVNCSWRSQRTRTVLEDLGMRSSHGSRLDSRGWRQDILEIQQRVILRRIPKQELGPYRCKELHSWYRWRVSRRV